jgi:transaldolase
MKRTKLHQLAELGQSIWLDYIRRNLITSGDLQNYVEDGLRGVTSNPAIFEEAIAGSDDYDEALRRLAEMGRSPREVYEALAIDDIQRAADILRPVYDRATGGDGYISLEVSPHLAHETEGTIGDARHLFSRVDRPNVMIKVPATAEGMPAIERLTAEGINVNVTLMFSLGQYDDVSEAYISGLERRAKQGGDLSGIASVASFFVSRVDVKIDQMLDDIGTPAAQELRGKIGIANAKMAYQRFKETFRGERWEHLADRGARLQRVLYGSTSTKDPAYPDTLYADNLIGPHTVNTLPPSTIQAFLDHGTVALTLESDLDQARDQLDQLAQVGMDLDSVTQELLDEGVEKFARPFESLMDTLTEEIERIKSDQSERVTANPSIAKGGSG